MSDFFKALDPQRDLKQQSFPIQNALISISAQSDAVNNNISIYSIGPFAGATIYKPDCLGSTTAGISPSGAINSIAKFFFNRYSASYYNSTSAVYTLPASHSASVNVVTARVIEVADPTRDHGIWPDTLTATYKYNGISVTAVDSSRDSFGTARENLTFGKLTDINDSTHVLGSIFYDYGVVLLHGGTGSASATYQSSVTGFAFASGVTGALTASTTASTIVLQNLSFKTYKILARTIAFCRLYANEFNYTSNPSANGVDFLQTETNATVYVTTVGLYDDRDNLLACAKISPCYRKNSFREATYAITLSL